MTASRAAIELIKHWEGFRAAAYQDGGGVWTIGYGSTGDVRQGDTITEPEAAERLMRHVEQVERQVSARVPPTTQQHQFDALCSLVYNCGPVVVNPAESTLIRKFLAGKIAAATAQFSRWNKIKGKSDAGLSNRRSAEAILFAGED